MADTNTPLTGLLLQETGAHNNDWGINLNAAITSIETMVKATRTTATVGGTTVLTLTTAQEPIQRVTGVLASNAIIEVPVAAASHWMFKNECTGAFTLTVKVNGQTGVVVPQGATLMLRGNGTDVVDVGIATPGFNGVSQLVGTLSFAADAYSAAANGYFTTLADGMVVLGRIANTNTTTTPTFNYNATGAKTILLPDGVAVPIGAVINGMSAFFQYRASTDKWYIMTCLVVATQAARDNSGRIASTAYVDDSNSTETQNAQVGTTYATVATDRGKMVTLSNAGAIVVTLSAATHAAKDRIDFLAIGAGQVSFVGGGGVTVSSSGSKLKLTGQFSGATVYWTSATQCYLIGDITT